MLTYAELIQASKLSSHEHSTYRKAELAVAHAVTALSSDPLCSSNAPVRTVVLHQGFFFMTGIQY